MGLVDQKEVCVWQTCEIQLLSLFLQELQQSGLEKRPCRSRSFRKAMSTNNLDWRNRMVFEPHLVLPSSHP